MVNGTELVPYDELLLCTGQQFHTAVPTGADVEELVTTSEALRKKLPSVSSYLFMKFFFFKTSTDTLYKILNKILCYIILYVYTHFYTTIQLLNNWRNHTIKKTKNTMTNKNL